MARKALMTIYRGLKSKLPVLADGELGFCKDTLELYIGTSAGNKLIGAGADMLKSIYDTNNDGKVDRTEKADTAIKLETARKINGVAFDGTADININVSGGAKVEQGYYYGNGVSYRSIYFNMSDPCLLFMLVNSINADGANGIYQAVYTNLLKEQVMSAGIYCATPFDNGGILMGTRVGALDLSYFQVTTTAALNKSGVYYEYIVVGN